MAKREEQLAWDSFKSGIPGRLSITRIENMLGEATPDTNGTNRNGAMFWMELKADKEWPKRSTTCPLRGAFEKGQLSFLRQQISWNANAFVLYRVGREYLLLNPSLDLEAMTKEDIIKSAFATTKNGVIEYLEQLT